MFWLLHPIVLGRLLTAVAELMLSSCMEPLDSTCKATAYVLEYCNRVTAANLGIPN